MLDDGPKNEYSELILKLEKVVDVQFNVYET